MPYSIQFTARALRDLSDLDRPVQQWVRRRIDLLAQDPFPPGVKKLHAEEPYYRIRVGNYRVIYQVEGQQLRVVIVKIGHHRDVYR
jgi:mRNA interferase RelE/StbE